MDSGVCDNVTSPDDVSEQTLVESVGSKKGQHFFSATRAPIPNVRDIKMPMIKRESMLMRAALVSKPLASVK